MKFGLRGIVILCLLCAASANGQAGQEQKPQMAEEVFKNVQILKGIPVDEFMDTMGMFAAATSMNCTDCHTSDSTASWEKFGADTPMKRTARRMMLMVNTLNKNSFAGARAVTCYTCHRGDQRPKVIPSLAVQYGVPSEDPNEIEIVPVRGAPSVDPVFDKYIQAIGGAQRLAALTSFAAKGIYSGYDTDHAKVPVDIFAKPPNQRTTIVHAPIGDSVRPYDGRAGWIAAQDKPVPLMPLTGGNLDGAKIDAMVAFPARIKQAFTQWRYGSAPILDRQIQIAQGINPRHPPLKLYFDAKTGPPVRLLRYSHTADGPGSPQNYYSAY